MAVVQMQFVGYGGGDSWVRFGSLGCKVMILFYFIFWLVVVIRLWVWWLLAMEIVAWLGCGDGCA